jgi:hypothetical protein
VADLRRAVLCLRTWLFVAARAGSSHDSGLSPDHSHRRLSFSRSLGLGFSIHFPVARFGTLASSHS